MAIAEQNKPIYFGIIVITCIILYYPGLSGGFYIDDVMQLQNISFIQNDLSLENILEFIGLFSSGPLKRPVSVLSFLIDSKEWPASPGPFLRTNVVIHLLNALALFILLVKIFTHSAEYKKYRFEIAFLSTAFWLLHPFQVSTVLYIVQRMAMLPVLFTLLGYLAYTDARLKYKDKPNKINIFYLFFSVYFFTILASLSKENGILLLFFIALFEGFIVTKTMKLPPLPIKIKTFLYIIPSVFLSTIIFYQFYKSSYYFEFKDFSMYERFLSEFRAISKYLYHLFVPQYLTEGLFTDGFKKSLSIINPIQTLFSIVLTISLLVIAWLVKYRNPLLSFSIFSFFIAHILESTLLPLELYFEHRNYMASLFLFLPLSLFLIKISKNNRFNQAFTFLILVYIVGTTHARVKLWGDELRMTTLTLQKYPESRRVAIVAAEANYKSGNTGKAERILFDAKNKINSVYLEQTYLFVLCLNKKLTTDDIDKTLNKIKTSKLLKHDVLGVNNLISTIKKLKCLNNNSNIYADKISLALIGNQDSNDDLFFQAKYLYQAEKSYMEENISQATDMYLKLFRLTNDYKHVLYIFSLYIHNNHIVDAKRILHFIENKFRNYKFYQVDWFSLEKLIFQMQTMLKEE